MRWVRERDRERESYILHRNRWNYTHIHTKWQCLKVAIIYRCNFGIIIIFAGIKFCYFHL